MMLFKTIIFFFFLNDPATTKIYTLPLHAPLPILNGLHRGDRTGLRRGDALLQFTDFGVQVRLITHRGRHAAEQRGNFRTRLHKSENVVDKQQRSEEHTSELQSQSNLVCRLLLEKK